jgi:predicted DNA-binding ribbon-helix-helix protein
MPPSVALEPAFWAVLERMAAERGGGLATLLASLDAGRGEQPLASAARLAALAWALQHGGPAQVSGVSG